ncbi:flagellar hook-length control protein FliK [Stenotrophobium rhamnosiphilum]|nr:flagellar hook-length control protein FliK [Stenotrophobium rhamnosiphilum]
MSSMGASADSQTASSRMSVDLSSAKEVGPKKAVAKDDAVQSSDDSPLPQLFGQVLSNATAGQKIEAKVPVAKTKVVSADATDAAATPDIALLMSLLNVLPPNDAPPATGGQDDAIATLAISPNTVRTPPAASPTNPLATLVVDTPDTSTPVAVALTVAAKEVPPVIDGRMTDKADLIASVLADIESPAPTPAPLLATPTHQAPTMTAVALALPVTAPGVLDELPITNREWPAALGHRLLWAVGEGMQKVEINVTPDDMGPINVQIRIENDKADLRFTATHAMTRDALEASLPRLRDMFSQQGLNLSQAQVFSQTPQDTSGRQPDTHQPNPHARNSSEPQDSEQAPPVRWRRGLVDDYA